MRAGLFARPSSGATPGAVAVRSRRADHRRRRRGATIAAPPGLATRPTGDRVREAAYNLIGPVDGASVLDLFAGSGALGLDALSRGAVSATFVESDRAACRVFILTILRASAERCLVRVGPDSARSTQSAS